MLLGSTHFLLFYLMIQVQGTIKSIFVRVAVPTALKDRASGRGVGNLSEELLINRGLWDRTNRKSC